MSRHRTDDRGSASVWLLAVGLAVVLLGGLVAVAGGVTVARHRAQNAADFGALAGALVAGQGEPAACAAAGRIVAANRATLTACRVDGLDVTVTVRVAVLRGPGAVHASAKAGPVRARALAGLAGRTRVRPRDGHAS